MALISLILRNWAHEDKQGLFWWCPGCNSAHSIKTSAGGWTYNNNPESPTFYPSVLVTGTEPTIPYEEWKSWFASNPDQPLPSAPTICHSFVTDGKMQFLGDCTHALANTTHKIPNWPSHNLCD
jgi:hypothetical protein